MGARFRRSPQALSAEVGDDVVALQAERGFAFGMEEVTAAVWRRLEGGATLDELVAALRQEYEVEEARCPTEVGALLDELLAEGMIERVEG